MKLLIIEDEPGLLNSITEYFRQDAVLCETASTYREAMSKIESYEYDCILLDINLPGGNGMGLLKYLRQYKKNDGVIIISARNSLDDKIEGFELGADDYITKPFHMAELNARFKAILRRKYGNVTNIMDIGPFTIDIPSRTVQVNRQYLQLTKNEFKLLMFLVSNKNKVVSRQAIAEHMFGYEADNLSSFDFIYSHVKNLKRKIKETGAEDLIQTSYGLGYKFEL